jgi:hypothetical protein
MGGISPQFSLLAETAGRITYDWARFQSYTERWHYLVLGLVVAAFVAFVVVMYRRDSVELRPGRGIFLAALRIIALLGVLAYYGNLERRTERQVTHNSRVVVLVDTSLSMGLHDTDSSSVPATPTRLEQVAAALRGDALIEQLRKVHDVILMRFDTDTSRLASLGKLTPAGLAPDSQAAKDAAGEEPAQGNPASKNPVRTDLVSSSTVDWDKIAPQGSETRLGQALRTVLHDERASPVAGIVVLTDGAQNAGLDPASAIQMAQEAKIPVYTVGIGSARRPANVRISDLLAPARAYPGDNFTVTGYIQAQELASRTVTVELTSRLAGDAGKKDEGKLEGTERVTLGSRGEIIPVKFEITPGEKGRRTYRLAVKAPPEDNNAADNQQEVDIEIVDRQTHVLLVASGPTREYTFLRNQLRRDKDVVVDVWLQSASGPLISQDAAKILDEFPATPQELFEYDAIVGFDPDWQRLDSEDVDRLERWVAEKAGGLIVIPGPVETDRWVQDPQYSKLRSLYPVEFNRRMAMLDDGKFGSETPWPIEFTREGLEAEFLWLADSAPSSQAIWASFPGVYGYFNVRGPKPGATVYAHYSDPESASSGQLPVYMAGQFFGAGRVFYLGSGEMWRLRALDDSYFEQFYTKLIRYVSQGRLLVGSSRGMLLVERDRYLLGNTVAVRAMLSNPQFEPLEAREVSLELVQPDSTVKTLKLSVDPARKGMYLGQFAALQEGTYRLELAVPDSQEEHLSKRVQVKVPDLERESPERNDALLSEIAKQTGGRYYVGAEAMLGSKGLPPLASQLKDRTQTSYLSGVKDRDFDLLWMRGLMLLICGALALEWLVRRLSKLA